LSLSLPIVCRYDVCTIGWISETATTQNFGLLLRTDYKDPEDGVIKSKQIKLHRGIALLNVIKRTDTYMRWEDEAKAGLTEMHELSIIYSELVGQPEKEFLTLCGDEMRATGPPNEPSSEGYQVKIIPFPTYTLETIEYQNPFWLFLGALGGMASLLGSVAGTLGGIWSLMLSKTASRRGRGGRRYRKYAVGFEPETEMGPAARGARKQVSV